MSTTLLKLVADLELSLASAVSVGATTATLSSATDSDDVALPSGKYGFTIDGDNSAKEFIVCDLVGTALTGVLSITVQGASSSGFANYHRVGATVTITDWAILDRMLDNLTGTTGFDSSQALSYDGDVAGLTGNQIPTVNYVLSVVSGGSVTFDQQVVSTQTMGENVTIRDHVYFKESDQKWWKVDADLTATFQQVQRGIALATTSADATCSVSISGPTSGFTGLSAGSKYYASNTAGAISSSVGTNTVFVGWALSTTSILFAPYGRDIPYAGEKDALVGGSTFGTPSSTNKYITQDYNSSATGLPVVRTYTPSSLGSVTTRFDVSNPAGTTFRYTYDGTGTDPGISAVTVPTGSRISIYAVATFSAGNLGTFTVTGSGANYFEVTNASGVVEVDKTLDDGYLYLLQTTTTWTKPTGLKYAVIESQAGGGGGGGNTTDATASGGGGGGGYVRELIAVASLGATETITVGAPGIPGVQGGGAGGTGGNTTFGAHHTASGGVGGAAETTGGAGGAATGGDVNVKGGTGGTGNTGATAGELGGTGGNSFYGFGGSGGNGSVGDASAGTGYGGGGGGAGSDGSDRQGGTGTPGIVIVTEYYS